MHLIEQLKSKQIVRQGDFILKSGEQSSYYFDFKSLISHPQLLTSVSYELSKLIIHTDNVDKIDNTNTTNNIAVVGVPSGALPYTTLISYIKNIPAMAIRDEKKAYGMQNQIEGTICKNAILIEDVITTGNSVMCAIDILKSHHINVVQILCILDRQAGGVEKLTDFGYNVSCLYKLEDFINERMDKSLDINTCHVGYQLLNLSIQKQTNIIASVDCDNLYEMVDIVGPHVCAIKLHADIFRTLDVDKLLMLKKKHNLLIIEDRKFSDIPYICLKQLSHMKAYADIVTVHGICGSQLVEVLGKEIGVLVVHNMTVNGNLTDVLYQNRVADMANIKGIDFVGFVSPTKVKNYLTLTTCINLNNSTDNLGQMYNYRNKSNKQDVGDLFIVGRGIYETDDILAAVLRYKQYYR